MGMRVRNFRLDDEQYAAFNQTANANKKSTVAVIRKLIDAYNQKEIKRKGLKVLPFKDWVNDHKKIGAASKIKEKDRQDIQDNCKSYADMLKQAKKHDVNPSTIYRITKNKNK